MDVDQNLFETEPANVREAINCLKRHLPKDTILEEADPDEEVQFFGLHREFGQKLRDAWNLQLDSSIANSLARWGIHHPDDMYATLMDLCCTTTSKKISQRNN